MKGLKGELIAEFIGSFILIFIGAGCLAALVLNGAQYGMWEISIVWGMGISLALYMTASISGGHINPAVTISLAVFRGFPWNKVIPYIIAQTAGTFTAAAVVYGLYREAFFAYESTKGIVRGSAESQALASIFSTYPAPYLNLFEAALVETVITAFLVAGIFAFIDERNAFAPSKALFPLTVGILVAIIGSSFGTLTGFAMNPARDFGPKLFTALAGWGKVALPGPNGYFLVPIIAPIIGGLIGGAAYDYLIHRFLAANTKLTGQIETNAKEIAAATEN